MSSLFIGFALRTLQENPTPLQVALVGGPRSGKTVFLSVLFNELQVAKTDRISFQPYGRETIEMVGENINCLNAGQWLVPTTKDSVFFFRANAIVGRSLLSKKFTVEIGDYAGERIDEFDSSSEEWLHRTEYFKYAVGCDIIFLAIDAEKLAFAPPSVTARMENQLVAAFQVLLDEKGVVPNERMRAPVALLILKSDLLPRDESNFRREMGQVDSSVGAFPAMARLISLCEKRCRSFKVFLVSAVGHLDKGGVPPQFLEPTGVTDPMIWALMHTSK